MKNFFKNNGKHLIWLGIFLLLVFIPMILADCIQKDWGNVEVTEDSFEITSAMGYESEVSNNLTVYEASEGAVITYKLYKPVTATASNPAPAVLLLHGYQNDHETCDAYCIELSRRGVVVLAIDEYGHGKTSVGIRERGWVDHKVTVNYGTDIDQATATQQNKKATYVELTEGGQQRYKIMMNFSNLSFFIDKYTKDNHDSTPDLLDSSMGGIAAYAYLSNMDFVQGNKMAISGHSMGTWASWTVAAAYSGTAIEPKATVLQCGEVFDKSAYGNINFNNILLLQAKWDEFNYFRDYQNIVSDDLLLKDTIKYKFLTENVDTTNLNQCEWNTTYGDMATGTARRAELLYTNHRLTTHDPNGMKAALDWFEASLGLSFTLENTDQVFSTKELFVIIAMFSAIASMFALFNILKNTKFFGSCMQALPNRDYRVKTGWAWWKGALITMAISFATYPFMTQLGHGLLPLPEDIFRMTIGNGFLSWYLLLIIIMLCTTIIPFKKSQKKDIKMDFVDLGLSRESHKDKFDWVLCGKMVLLAFILVGYMYLQCVLCEAIFMLDFRFVWPFFKGFTLQRFGQFLVYIIIFVVFFVLNNSKIFAQMRVKEASVPGFKGFISCWYKYALCMVGGILMIILLEYIPFFADLGPGSDLLFGSTFGGPFMSLLIVFAPQVIVFSLICTYCYRKTGNVYLGAVIVAILACWVVTGGSAMF